MTSNPVYRFFASEKNTGPLLLRLLLAAIFFCHLGRIFFVWFPDIEINVDWNPLFSPALAHVLARAFVAVEMVFGLVLLFGFFTRLVAFASALLLFALVIILHLQGGAVEIRYPFAVAILALSLVFLGGGRFSVDRAISRQLLPSVG